MALPYFFHASNLVQCPARNLQNTTRFFPSSFPKCQKTEKRLKTRHDRIFASVIWPLFSVICLLTSDILGYVKKNLQKCIIFSTQRQRSEDRKQKKSRAGACIPTLGGATAPADRGGRGGPPYFCHLSSET